MRRKRSHVVCLQGTADMYAMEIEDVSKAHGAWKEQAAKLDAEHAIKDREINELVRCQAYVAALWLQQSQQWPSARCSQSCCPRLCLGAYGTV